MPAHRHAELMKQYAQDAAETETPWERWELYTDRWEPCVHGIGWSPALDYRRKPALITVEDIPVPEGVDGTYGECVSLFFHSEAEAEQALAQFQRAMGVE